MVVTLARDLMARSFEARFHDTSESLCLARLANEVAQKVGETGYLSAENLADLHAEGWAFLGNAERINSNMGAAETALRAAEEALEDGTGDRDLKADLLSFLASLRSSQGRAVEAAQLFDREIALRRLLGDQERLGVALVDRGRMVCWAEGPTIEACQFVRDGLELVKDRHVFLMGLLVLAEAFARDDRGFDALLLLSDAKLVMGLLEPGRFESRYRWIRGITYRALGELERAEELLVPVRAELVANELTAPAAVVTMDLVSVFAHQQRFREARILAAEAHELLLAQGLENKALAASLLLQKALAAETEVSRMAVAVANFFARHGYNRSARLEWEEQ